MRTTLDLPEELLHQAMRVSQAKTKTMVVVSGLQELTHRNRLERLRALRGRLELAVDVRKSRKR